MATRTVYRSAERKPPVRLTEGLRETIARLLAEGQSQNAVARAVGCSQHLVHKVASGKIAAQVSGQG
ncbi:MAG: helix-turn-helix domain-containing protein [Hyphomicrobiaceae bacterium]|jgi:DNA invertase Pin-like site-specific DNA recombinase